MLSLVLPSIGDSEDAHFYKPKLTGTQLRATALSEYDMRRQQAESTGIRSEEQTLGVVLAAQSLAIAISMCQQPHAYCET